MRAHPTTQRHSPLPRAAGLIPFDLSDTVKAAVDARGADALYRSDHHSADGNRVVADLVMRELVNRRLVTQTAHR